MLKLCPTIAGLIVVFSSLGEGVPTWPAAIDELEDVMFLNTGYKSRGFSSHVTPCSFSEFGAGRQTAAEWLRIGFHDMATTNVNFAPHGGVDGSMQFELNDGENIGAGFVTTLETYGGLFNSRLPIADLIALGVYASVRACDGPIVPMRGGRIDATKAGNMGVPQPQNGQSTFKNQFTRMGFNTTAMIQMTACGHTIGGVHAGNFPTIVAPGTVTNDYQLFDNSFAFDNSIATRYIAGPPQDVDPLSVGISTNSGRDADTAVFSADGNVTVQAMTNADTFNSVCSAILQEMIEVVDPDVVAALSDIIQPYEVKPSGLQLTLTSATQLTFSGDIRVRTTVRAASAIASVKLTYLDRTGAGGTTITTAVSGSASGFDDSFTFYGFSVSIPATTSISSFTLAIASTGGLTTTYSNNGNGFPIQDAVIVQTPSSCFSSGNLSVVAAIRTGSATPVLNNAVKVARVGGRPIPSPVPMLVNSTATMVKGSVLGPYTLYTATANVTSATGSKYGVVSGAAADDFKDVADLGSCSGAQPSSSSSSPSSTKTSSTSSATATPTLVHKQTVGKYQFQGCYTEGTNVRALPDVAFYNYTAMTMEMCAGVCAGYTYFGVEYGGECYCGAKLDVTSTLVALSDCSFICPGDSYEYCGAGNRLEMYRLGSASSSSVIVSTTSSSSSTKPVSTSSSVRTSSPSSQGTSSSSSKKSSSFTSTKPVSTSSVTTSFSSSKKTTSSSSIKSSSSSKPTSSSLKTTSTSSFKTSTSSVKSSSSTKLASSSTKASTSSSVVKPSTTSTKPSSSSSSASATQTLGNKPTISGFKYYGCYTEATSVRALSSATYYDYPAMTMEECAANCTANTYFGVEYGGECYCGDVLNEGSIVAPESDCNFVCPGNQYEYCGAGNRLSVYIKSGTSGRRRRN